jgi:AraC-like DNA-binding protein
MPSKEKIFSVDLEYDHLSAPFVIKTMEEVDKNLGGIADKPHRHNYYTIVWPFDATGKHIIDFKEYPILPHHLFFVSPEQVHQVITNPKPTGFVILFTSEFLGKSSIREDFISNLRLFKQSDETPPLPLSDSKMMILKGFVDQMMVAFCSHSDLRFETIGAYLKLFLIECNSSCTLNPESNTQNVEVGKNLVKNFKAIVDKHYATWHQVKDYADSLNVSPNYLNEVIKSAIGISAKDYIQNRIVLEAKRMVVFTEKSSKEIGFDLGFDDPSHFSKFFKINAGLSLVQFKESVG